MLVTHRGLSGPAILQISSYWKHGQPILLDFVPDQKKDTRILDPLFSGRRDQSTLQKALRDHLPQRLADHMATQFSEKGWTNTALEAREHSMRQWAFHPNGTEGFQKAEVTAGGIDTAALNSRTMEVKTIPGLFFIGEVVDVTGHLGGYNFQWAWASATAAAQSV